MPVDAPITVVGGGLTGIETAAELAEQGRKVTLVCGGTLAPYLSAPGRRSAAKWLSRHGVTVRETDVVTEVRPDAIVVADGTVRSSALTIWATGFGVPELAAASGLRTDSLGRLLTDETLTSVDDDRVIAVRRSRGRGGQIRSRGPPGRAPRPRARAGATQAIPARRHDEDRADHRAVHDRDGDR